MRRRALLPVGLSLTFALGGACGGETLIQVEVDLTAFAVPAEVDLIHAELTDDAGAAIGKSFSLGDGETQPMVTLVPGQRTAKTVTLRVYAFKGTTRIAVSAPRQLVFRDGEAQNVGVAIPRP